MRLIPPLLAAVVAAPLASQAPAITIADGPAATDLVIRSFSETFPLGPPKVVLSNVELLPIEITNRTLQDELSQGRARRLVRDGLVRVELPGQRRLLRYRRGGGDRWGFLLVDHAGASVLLELPGVGAGGKDDPFTDRIGVAADGWHAALATAAGRLWIARLDGQLFASTGTPSRPLALARGVAPLSLCVGPTQAWFQTEDKKLWRCGLADAAVPAELTPQPAPAVLKDLMAQSGDGRTVAFLAGPNKDTLRIWLVGETGAALALPPPPSKYEEPTYLPEVAGGPALALNENGTRLFYDDSSSRDELFLLDTGGQTSTTWLTSDANFQPYIGSGILPIFSANIVAVAIGDPGKLDLITAQTAQPLVGNLTQSGGNTVRPYGTGALAPAGAWLLASGALLEADDDPQSVRRLRSVVPATGAVTTLVEGMAGLPALGAAWDGAADLLVAGAASVQLRSGASLAPWLVVPAAVQLSAPVRAPGSAFTLVRASAGGQSALVFVVAGTLVALPPEAAPQGFAITASGNVLVAGSAGILLGGAGGVVSVPASGAVLRLLSGAGA